MYGFMWVVAIIVFLLLEAATYQFISIWFAGGALGALVAFGFGGPLKVQILVFFVLSALLLILTRPLVKKIMNERKEKTNIDELPGKLGQVTEKIDNMASVGRVKLGAMEWTARSDDGSVIEPGAIVKVIRLEGVKLIVKVDSDERKDG